MIPKPSTTGNQERYLQERYCPPPSGDDAMLSVAARVPKEGTQLQEPYCTPHPTPPLRIWRRCHAECSSTDLGCRVMRILVAESRGVWLRNRLFLVAESSFFGCGIVFFLVAESSFFGCGIVSDFGCNRRNMVAESDFIPSGGIKRLKHGTYPAAFHRAN